MAVTVALGWLAAEIELLALYRVTGGYVGVQNEVGKGAFQELDQVAAVGRFTKYAGRARSVRDIVPLITAAMKATVAGRPGAAYMDIPSDILMAPAGPSEVLLNILLDCHRFSRFAGSMKCSAILCTGDQKCVTFGRSFFAGSRCSQPAGRCHIGRAAARCRPGRAEGRRYPAASAAVRSLNTSIIHIHPTSCSAVLRSIRCIGRPSPPCHISGLLESLRSGCCHVGTRWFAYGGCRPLVVIGKGAAYSQADAALRSLVAATQLPFLATAMGRGVVPDNDPGNTNAARSLALAKADVAIIFGAR